MFNPCVFKLNLDVTNIVNPSWEKPFTYEFFVKDYDNYEDWVTILNKEFVDKINGVLPISRLMIFNKPAAWRNQDAHIDPGVLFALNIVQTISHQLINNLPFDTASYMEWFEPLDPVPKPVSYSPANTPYISYKPEEIKLLHKESVDRIASIVKTDIPHRVKIGVGHRTCFSFRFKHDFKSLEEVYNFYKELGWTN